VTPGDAGTVDLWGEIVRARQVSAWEGGARRQENRLGYKISVRPVG